VCACVRVCEHVFRGICTAYVNKRVEAEAFDHTSSTLCLAALPLLLILVVPV